MTAKTPQRDVIFLVADRNIEAALLGLLGRCQSLAIRRITSVVRTHPERDPGCFNQAHEFLRVFRERYLRAIVIFDREGCGSEESSRVDIEAEVEERLSKNGWDDRAKTVVIDPELESWVWSDSPEVDSVLGWAARSPRLRSWLLEKRFLQQGSVKPARPKEALEAALHVVHKPRSSAIYEDLAMKVSLRRCSDPAFIKLRTILQSWFPVIDIHESRNTQ